MYANFPNFPIIAHRIKYIRTIIEKSFKKMTDMEPLLPILLFTIDKNELMICRALWLIILGSDFFHISCSKRGLSFLSPFWSSRVYVDIGDGGKNEN